MSDFDIDRAHLTTILSNMMEGVIAVDTNGRVLFLNQALARIFDISVAPVRGRHLLEVLRQNQVNLLIQNVLQDQKPRTDEIRTFNPDEHLFEAIAVPLIDNERHVGALLVLHEITKVRRLEQVRRDFIANVSHELRTPLASIKGFAETLRDGALEDPAVAKEFLRSIEKQTDNMTALVEDLLDLSAIESGQRVPYIESLALHDLVNDVVKGLKPIADKKKIVIESSIPADLPALSVDRGHMKQVLANLLDNAIKFNHEGGRVQIVATPEAQWIQVRVSDSGVGIPAQDLPRIFERFYRVDKARSRAMGGTGLGLSIVKHLIEANGGHVSVDSSVGKGSMFTVTLPLSLPR